MSVLWAIQRHETSPSPKALYDACNRVGALVSYESWSDDEAPDLTEGARVVFYGSCSFIDNIASMNRWNPGIFFDAVEFRYARYLEAYGREILNSDCVFTELSSMESLGLLYHRRLFVRSENDSKKLSGSVWKNDELREYIRHLERVGNLDMLHHPIVVAPKKTIDCEWRVFLVKGRATSGSQYRHFGDLCCSPGIPDSVRVFAERLAAHWSPSVVFVMDIAKCGSRLYVLELNGFNSCGFYASDVARIVHDVEALIFCGENF